MWRQACNVMPGNADELLNDEFRDQTQVIRGVVVTRQSVLADTFARRHVQRADAADSASSIPHVVDCVALFDPSPLPRRIRRLEISCSTYGL